MIKLYKLLSEISAVLKNQTRECPGPTSTPTNVYNSMVMLSC